LSTAVNVLVRLIGNRTETFSTVTIGRSVALVLFSVMC
jgi:hypothetical protein